MSDHPHDISPELDAARTGSLDALGRVLETYRAYLLLVADREIDPKLQAKGGASDLVQETFLEAQRDFARFQGRTDGEFRAWLRQLLLHNLANFARRYRGTDKRQVHREVGLAADSSGANPAGALPADTPTPSRWAMAGEQDAALQRAMEQLPEDYRRVLLMRYQDELSFDAIAEKMQRSAGAVRKLWLRAVERLRQELEGPR
jgi:RNA polymerase sigma-70 factor (ECF subfamily)